MTCLPGGGLPKQKRATFARDPLCVEIPASGLV